MNYLYLDILLCTVDIFELFHQVNINKGAYFDEIWSLFLLLNFE